MCIHVYIYSHAHNEFIHCFKDLKCLPFKSNSFHRPNCILCLIVYLRIVKAYFVVSVYNVHIL